MDTTKDGSALGTTTMPAVSTRYKSIKSRTSRDFNQTFIFNDVNKLKQDLQKSLSP